MTSPFKPLYKPSLSDFEKAIADIKDRVEHIEYAIVNISLEEQRQANWFKLEKKNEKKTTLIRYLLHSEEEFDEDDFSNAIPLMVKLLSTCTLQDLLDIDQKRRERVLMSKFNMFGSGSSERSDEEGYDEIVHDSDGNYSLNSWTDFEQPTYGVTDYGNEELPRAFRFLDSIIEEREPSETSSIYATINCPSTGSLHSIDRESDASGSYSNGDVISQSHSGIHVTGQSRSIDHVTSPVPSCSIADVTDQSGSSEDVMSQSRSTGDVTLQSRSFDDASDQSRRTSDVRLCTRGNETATFPGRTISLSDINIEY